MSFDPKDVAAPSRRRTKTDKPSESLAEKPHNSGAADDAAAEPPMLSAVMIEAPIGICFAGYAQYKVEATFTDRQAAALQMLWSTLSETGERAFGGRRTDHPAGSAVNDRADALRWLLDRYADAAEAETGKVLVRDFLLRFRN